MSVSNVDAGQRRRYAGAKSVVKVQREADGSVTRTVLSYPGGKGRKKRVSRPFRRLDRGLRKLSKLENVASSEYIRRHDRSNRKRKNGALKNIRKNVRRSVREGVDTL